MNKTYIIGNLTHDPELRSTSAGVPVCTMSVAVNRRFAGRDGQKQTDFFRVTAWRGLGENCARYLSKGKKIAAVGEVTANAYTGKDGQVHASLELNAEEIEFLSPRGAVQDPNMPADMQGFADIGDESLPWI